MKYTATEDPGTAEMAVSSTSIPSVFRRTERPSPCPSPLASGRFGTQRQTLATHFEAEEAEEPTDPEIGSADNAPKIAVHEASSSKVVSTLVWRDLTVIIRGKRNYSKVVNTSTGYALPYSLTGIMGPSRSGKSTLLRALADALPRHAKVYGEILLNGHTRQLKYGSFAYIGKDDQLIETLTVREVLHYSALLRFPNGTPSSQKTTAVTEIMKMMELEEIADLHIGSKFYKKGLSRGERRRLCIAMELLLSPSLVFIDEPVHGLDSVSAILMMTTLKRLKSTGRTVLVTIQHAITQAFDLLDNICLLTNGKTIYFGGALTCLEFFSNAGYPCPLFQNISDHFLKVLDPEFDKILKFGKNKEDQEQVEDALAKMGTAVMIRKLETAYMTSNDAASIDSMVSQLSMKEGQILSGKSHAGALIQLAVWTWRSFLNMARDFGYYWLRLIMSILIMLCLGSVFVTLGRSYFSIQDRALAIFFTISSICMMSIGGFPSLVKDIKIYFKESTNQQNGADIFILGNLLSSIPFLFLISISCSVIGYFMLRLQAAFSLFMFFVLDFFLCLIISEGLMMVVASVLPRTFEGILAVIGIQGFMMLAGGYFRTLNELPKPIWKYPVCYISFYTFAYEGMLQNEFYAMSFSNGTKAPTINGEQILQDTYNMSSLLYGKWANLLILVLMAVVYRIILFLTIKYSENLRIWSFKFQFLIR